jgi:anti-anti-sigma factor
MDDMSTITWNKDLHIKQVPQLKQYLLDHLSPADVNVLSIPAMEKLDLAGLQVLLCARQWLQQQGGDLYLLNNAATTRVNKLSSALGFSVFATKGTNND